MRLHFLHEICSAKAYTGQEVQYLHQKVDGHRVTAIKQPHVCETPLALYTRSQSDLFTEIFTKAKGNKIWPWLVHLLDIPPYTSIDGELYVPGKPASFVKTAIKTCDPALRFIAFAVPWLERKRRYTDPLEWAMEQCSMFKISFASFIKLDSPQEIDPEEWIKKASLSTEGWVAKKYHYSQWYKLKRRKTIDLIVTGIMQGKGKYEGMAGALICSGYDQFGQLREICACSGMTDEQRRSINDKDLGRVCEVQYQEVASLGRLRHPNFVRWRDDEKQPLHCTLAQEPELLHYWSQRGD